MISEWPTLGFPSCLRAFVRAFFFLLLLSSLYAAPPAARLVETHREFFKDYCIRCHGAEKQKGKVRLDNISFEVSANIPTADLWQKILNALNAGEMPPENKKQPDKPSKTEFLDDLSRTLADARKVLGDHGGKITMRRLNQREYRNTIRELLGIEIDVRDLPDDGGAGTFDTVGSSLFMSSDQFEQYLTLGRKAIDEAFARQSAPASNSTVFRFEPEKVANPEMEKRVKRFAETHERFSRWKVGVDKAVAAPENQESIKKLQEKDPRLKKADFLIYYHADQLKGAPSPKDFGFRDTHNAAFGNQRRRDVEPYHQHYLTLPHRQQGAYLTIIEGFMRIDLEPPDPLPPGNYILRLRVGAVKGTPTNRHFIEIGHPDSSPIKRNLTRILSTNQITGTVTVPQILEVPLQINTDTMPRFSIRERQPSKGDLRSYYWHEKRKNGYGPEPAIWVDWVELEGPVSQDTKRQTWKQRREVELHANRKVGGTYNGYFKGGYEDSKAFLETGKPQKGITDEPKAKFRIREYERQGPSYRRYLEHPLTKAGAFLTISNVNKEEYIALPPEHPTGWLKTKHVVESLPPGDYKLRFRIGVVEGTEKERHFVDFGSVPHEKEFNLMQTFQISGTTQSPQTIEVPVSLSADSPRKFAIREKRDIKLDNERFKAALKETGMGPTPVLWIDWVEWEGPMPRPQSRNLIAELLNTSEWKTEIERARKFIERFATHAFRDTRPSDDYVNRLAKIFESRLKAGDTFNDALKEPLSAILASPGFLYLNEPGVEGKPRTLTSQELATRLSYFLWSAPPDTQLLSLARSDELKKSDVLAQQVDRLIDDPRSFDFVIGFTHQWLGLDRLDFFQFNTSLYRDFDESAKAAAREEVFRTVEHLLRNRGNLSDLLKSDYVVINGLLATYYGIEGVTGDEFRKVSLPANSPRGGLLGMAAIMAMGSNGEHTSPVERGAWVLRKLMNNPPPPAPPNVPQLSRLEGELLTTRERILAHQEEPQCLSCHRKIDPIGFGLENFDAVGKWRTEDHYQKKGVGKKTWKIDPSGAIHNGPSFKNYFELRDIIASHQENFARGFTEALIEYALGRPYGFSDADLAQGIVDSAKKKTFNTRQFIHALVASKQFQAK